MKEEDKEKKKKKKDQFRSVTEVKQEFMPNSVAKEKQEESDNIKEKKKIRCVEEKCNHDFTISIITTEATGNNYIYQRVGYSVCRKCGEIKKR